MGGRLVAIRGMEEVKPGRIKGGGVLAPLILDSAAKVKKLQTIVQTQFVSCLILIVVGALFVYACGVNFLRYTSR